jgi:hypothetical protein
MMSQYAEWAVTTVILLLAVVYAFRRTAKVLRGDSSPCTGCELKKNCKKFGQSK